MNTRYEVVIRSWRSNPYEWLQANHREEHFVESLLRPCRDQRLRLAVVINDRTTALMMKLALG